MPAVSTERGMILAAYFKNWDFPVPGSPTSSIWHSPRKERIYSRETVFHRQPVYQLQNQTNGKHFPYCGEIGTTLFDFDRQWMITLTFELFWFSFCLILVVNVKWTEIATATQLSRQHYEAELTTIISIPNIQAQTKTQLPWPTFPFWNHIKIV